MQSRRIAIDVNILVWAALGVRVRELIDRYCDQRESRWSGGVKGDVMAGPLNGA